LAIVIQYWTTQATEICKGNSIARARSWSCSSSDKFQNAIGAFAPDAIAAPITAIE
jgi:hypothetical protein